MGAPLCSQTPGAQAALAELLFLQQAQAVQLDGAGDEAHLAALLHQPSNPPVIIVLLQGTRLGQMGENEDCRSQPTIPHCGKVPLYCTLSSLPRSWYPEILLCLWPPAGTLKDTLGPATDYSLHLPCPALPCPDQPSPALLSPVQLSTPPPFSETFLLPWKSTHADQTRPWHSATLPTGLVTNPSTTRS